MSNVFSAADSPNDWKLSEATRNALYCNLYNTNSPSRDNPDMQRVLKAIKECNVIRYASYRAAAKMQILHRELSMQHVNVDLVAGVFERHRLSITENCVTLEVSEIEDVLSDIYFAAHKESGGNFSIEIATKLGIDYILNIFDKENRGNILVFSVKLALTLLCNSKLQEKYGYLYHQLADHNACLSRAALNTFLINICKITEMLGESAAYGLNLVQSHIDDCFVESQGSLGVTESEFAAWIMTEPPLLMWLSTLNRLKSAEHVTHNIKCSSCKMTPIQGPRYSCLRCTGYHQCQGCFLLGKTSNKHKLKHPVREYCIKTTNREITKLIVELIRNKLRICPSRTVMVHLEDPSPDNNSEETKFNDNVSIRSTVRRKVLNDPQKELQSIISHLEEENKQLQIELLEICGSRAERLHRHRATIESQLQRLKILKKYLFTERGQQPQGMTRMQSTPMLPPIASRIPALPLDFELSPIVRQGTIERQRQTPRLLKMATLSEHSSSFISNASGSEAQQPRDKNYSSLGIPDNTKIDLSTWIGGHRTALSTTDSGFSQWLRSSDNKEQKFNEKQGSNGNASDAAIMSHSPVRENTPSLLQRPDKHSQHSSLQNIQGDLNDILDRLQNMVANDCLLEESYIANDNCELKRATTEMEDLLTGLIEGMESRKTKLTTVV